MSRKSAGLPDVVIRGQKHADRGYCYDSGYDGPVIHTIYCSRDQQRDTAVSGSGCIRSNQDGAAIAAAREITADRRRFTPPEYREHPVQPRAVIAVDKRQPLRVLALRGRAKVPGAEWTTWETYEDRGDGTFWGDMKRMTGRTEPKEMPADEARSIVAEFSSRVPTHEFQVVLARLVIEEEQIA